MDIEKRFDLIKSVGEEIITEQELRDLLEKKKHFIAYDGFEPSGRMHIAQGIFRTINVNKMIQAGAKFKMLVADWFAWLNNKMGGDMKKIEITGNYFIEVWKSCGMKTKDVEFIWAKDLVRQEGHWTTTLNIARHATVNRIARCSQIMGRKSGEPLSAAQIIYPCMQAADIFHLKCDVAQLGMDQRKVNMLAREIGPKIGFWKPVVVSHPMILGLTPPTTKSKNHEDMLLDMKMSKSKPESAVFMDDSEEEVKKKILGAYCPAKQVELNPILEYCKYLIFEKFKEMKIERPKKFGGNISFSNYSDLEKEYVAGDLYPLDLKNATVLYINKMLEPTRIYFKKNKKAADLLKQVKSFKVTR